MMLAPINSHSRPTVHNKKGKIFDTNKQGRRQKNVRGGGRQ